MPRHKQRRVEKPGDIKRNLHTGIKHAISGIIGFPKERQLYVLGQSSDPSLIVAIATSTSHPEVKIAAELHPNYPHPEIEKKPRRKKVTSLI